MSFHILLSSAFAKRESYGEQRPNDFTVRFNPPIRLSENKQYRAAFNKLLTMQYSWRNLAAEYNNNKIRWRKKSSDDWQVLTFPDGQYSYENLEKSLQAVTGFVDPNDKTKGYNVRLYFDFTIYRVVILAPKDYEFDFTQGEFASLIGYGKEVLSGAENYVGGSLPNITRGVDWIFIHVDLITRRANDLESSDVLFYFSTAELQASFPFTKEPRRLSWQPVNKKEIREIRVWITDGENNKLDLNGLPVALEITIQEEEFFL